MDGAFSALGNLSGKVWGAASVYDAGISSNITRYGIMGSAAAVGLWGASGDDGLFSARGAIGAAGFGIAGFAGMGALARSKAGASWNGAVAEVMGSMGPHNRLMQPTPFIRGFSRGGEIGSAWMAKSNLSSVVPRAEKYVAGGIAAGQRLRDTRL